MESQPQNPEFRINPENFQSTLFVKEAYKWFQQSVYWDDIKILHKISHQMSHLYQIR